MTEADQSVAMEVASGARDPLEAARAALDEQNFSLASACLDVGLAADPDRLDLLTFAVGFYGSRDDFERAAAIRERLSTAEQTTPELTQIGREHLGRNEFASAIVAFSRAAQADPQNDALRHLQVTALQFAGKPKDVLALLIPRVREGTATEVEFIEVVAAAQRDERPKLARLIATAGAGRFETSSYLFEREAELVYATFATSPAETRLKARHSKFVALRLARPLFLFSAVLAHLGDYPRSLEACREAREIDSTDMTLVRHQIAVLGQLGGYQEAASLCDQLLATGDETDADLQAAFAIFAQTGQYGRCVPVGARLIESKPDDLEFASVYQALLQRFLYSELLKHRPPESRPPPGLAKTVFARRLGLGSSIAIASRTIHALFLREMKTRFGRSRLGYLWVVFEPLAHISVMIAIIGLLNRSGHPPIGPTFALFYFTGILPYHMFTHTAGHLMTAGPENRPLLQIPRVTLPDVFVARALLEFVTEMLVGLILVVLFLALGMDAIPLQPLGVLAALALLWFAAIGVGMINAVGVVFFPGWERVWGALTSILYFSSGTFFIPRMMPEWVREILKWNPILQGIELVRINYFHEPSPEWLMPQYLIGWAIVPIAIGLVLERTFRGRLLERE